MIDQVMALAASGSAALMAAAMTDVWSSTRSAVARVFGRHDPDGQRVMLARLDRDVTALEAAGTDRDRAREELTAAWRTRLGDWIEEHPAAADDLEELIQQICKQLPSQQQAWFMSVVGRDNSIVYAVMRGNIYQMSHDPRIARDTNH
ncbi:hypothetical protein ACFZAD_39520 [Streptomyces iakyrus]|uniref:Uncharacterized protein n=1 Tax=Streptomyces olindensis TaxID=358823 RepID=A0ABV2Y0N2_9ACTN